MNENRKSQFQLFASLSFRLRLEILTGWWLRSAGS